MTEAPATDTPPPVVGMVELEEDDPKNLRWALFVAVAVHVVLFSLHLPELSVQAQVPSEDERHYRFVPTPRFEQEPPPQEVIPRERRRRVPVPDPTPDGPEPIRPVSRIEVPVAFTGGDVFLDIPTEPPPADPVGPYRVGGNVRAPVKLHTPAPRYPELARRARVEGLVILEAIIDTTGHVTEVKVVKPAPMGLDAAALATVRTWRFEPATLQGRPVAVVYHLTIKFELQ